MENKPKTQQEIEQEILELNKQFSAFLHAKGITARFKLALNNMSESAKKQHSADVAEFEAIKVQVKTQAAVARANAISKK